MADEFYGARRLSPDGVWCVHSYYTTNPQAPDGSGRLLLSGADLDAGKSYVYILSPTGEILARFGENTPDASFWHTGAWQTWSPDARYVYYQSGSLKDPRICRYEVSTGKIDELAGDMEGAPPSGEPIISGFLGMLYAAGYGDGHYHPEAAPFRFEDREAHGLFRYSFANGGTRELALSVAQVLAAHPERESLLAAEGEFIARTGHKEGFTLMLYCVRWNPQGDRLLFHFGNHNVDKSRGEGRICYVFTAKRDLTDIRLALNTGGDKVGVHFGWHPDGEHLIGYYTHPDAGGKLALCQVGYDGSDLKIISRHASGGHPSISPIDERLLLTDEYGKTGRMLAIDLDTDTVVADWRLPRTYGDTVPPGRHPLPLDPHPVFVDGGKRIVFNILPDRNGAVYETDAPERKKL